jgi:hypothetical protein
MRIRGFKIGNSPSSIGASPVPPLSIVAEKFTFATSALLTVADWLAGENTVKEAEGITVYAPFVCTG